MPIIKTVTTKAGYDASYWCCIEANIKAAGGESVLVNATYAGFEDYATRCIEGALPIIIKNKVDIVADKNITLRIIDEWFLINDEDLIGGEIVG